MSAPSQFRTGLMYGMVAYLWWGLVPLYFVQIKHIDAWEILAHRIVWSFPLLLIIALFLPNSFRNILQTVQSRRLMILLTVAALFLAGNWLIYIYATTHGRVAEASLGYYMMPLVNALLATVFLREKLRPAHYPALSILAVGVFGPLILSGTLPWIAIVLPATFGLYGLVRKRISVDSLSGLTIETLILLPASLAYVILAEYRGLGAVGQSDLTMLALILFSGPATVVPLLTYILSIRRLPLLTQAFIQFIAPSMQFLVAFFVLQEQMTTSKWFSIICVWFSVLIFIGDALFRARGSNLTNVERRTSKSIASPAAPEPVK